MFELLRKLQEKSEGEKKMIALGVSSGITLVIFFVWASAFFIKIGGNSIIVTQEDVEAQKNVTEKTPSPGKLLKENLANATASFKELRSFLKSLNSIEYSPEDANKNLK